MILRLSTLLILQIQECCEKAVLLNAKGEPRGGVAKPAAAAKAPSQPKPVIRKPVVSLVWGFLFLVTMVKVVDAKRMKSISY